MCKTKGCWCWGVVAFLPLAFKLPYLVKAFWTSPTDRLHLLVLAPLIAGAAIGAILLARRRPSQVARVSRPFAALAFLALVGFACGIWTNVHAVQTVSAVVFAWSVLAAMRGGWRWAAVWGPAFVLLLFLMPGVIFWMARAGSFAQARSYPACRPEFRTEVAPGFLGRERGLTPGAERLFRTSSARSFAYAMDNLFIEVLAVTCGRDVHEIHPAAYCLRAQGCRIVSEAFVEVAVDGAEPVQVTEIVARSGVARIRVWSWYSSATESTGNFLRFRRRQTIDGPWTAYTLSVIDGPAAKDGLAAFVRRMMKVK